MVQCFGSVGVLIEERGKGEYYRILCCHEGRSWGLVYGSVLACWKDGRKARLVYMSGLDL